MGKHAKINGMTITLNIELPDWINDEKYDYSTPVYYDKWHAYKGSYSHTNYGNLIEDSFFNEFAKKGLDEISIMHHYAIFQLDNESMVVPLLKEINEFLKNEK